MGEPLCTFKLYSRFRDLSGNPIFDILSMSIDVKLEDRAERLKQICSLLPDVNKHTFVYIIRFFHKVIEQCDYNKVLYTTCYNDCIDAPAQLGNCHNP
jgi:hypothetical protein